MGNLLSKPKMPEADPEIERRRKQEQARADAEKEKETQKTLREETLISTGSGTRNSLFSSGRKGFSLRSLLGG